MARSNEPFWWAPFSAGMMIGALFVPILIVITGFVFPFIRADDPQDVPEIQALVNHFLFRLLLFVVIALSFFHWAHRFRYILFDLGVHGGKNAIAALCYGSAIVGTIVAGLIALHAI